ncbi:hypothetical protein HK097_002031 [Rhizophlyctis rosea]|uniref:Uncharacterized protein n=1 Tax=Rhizophlyctis rosea TaxID=64517 RepID=A0AAD5X1I0_9FUNG|nr:hypothetical protein HK097_002031 [Rhizophlyctis rosea]
MTVYSAHLTEDQGPGLIAWDSETGEPAKCLDLGLTAAHMLMRSTLRRANGRYKRKAHKYQILGVAVTVFVFMSLIGAGITIISPQGGLAISVGQWSGLAVIAAVFILLLFVIKLSLTIQWYFYSLVLAVAILLILNKGQLSPQTDADPSTPLLSRIFTGPNLAVIVTLIVVHFVTLVATLVRRTLYPRLIKDITSEGAVKWWWIRPILIQPGTFQYTLYDPFTFSLKSRTFSYTGSVNSLGQPHGQGMWCDDAEDGEVTVGFWKDGVLEAPFRGREFGSGDSFCAIRVGVASCSGLEADEYGFWPRVREEVVYGVGGAECSVSG